MNSSLSADDVCPAEPVESSFDISLWSFSIAAFKTPMSICKHDERRSSEAREQGSESYIRMILIEEVNVGVE